MSVVTLNGNERTALDHLLKTSTDARHLVRAQALVWLDDGDSVAEVAERLMVTRQCVYNWVHRFEDRADVAVEARVADAPRGGRPATALDVIDAHLEAVIATDPRELGYRSTIWTASLLQKHLLVCHHIDVSTKSVSRALARLEISWKRPRHVLARRDWYWRQAKGGSNAGSVGGNVRSS